MLKFALKYLNQGLSVIPLRQEGKEPLIDWKEYQSRLPSEEEIRSWWAKWPAANIGVVTGSISNLLVVDADGVEGINNLLKLGLASKVTSLSGKGKHLWFKNDPTIRNSASQLAKGLDIRAEGGYIVVPPSVHPNGRRYRWIQPLIPIRNLPLLPTHFVRVGTVSEIKSAKEEGWIAKALKEMKNGNIDDTLFTICSRLRADNWSASDALVLLKPHAERVGATPGHLEEKIENVWNRYEPNERRESLNSVYGRNGEVSRQSEGLVIHSPSKPESWEGYRVLREGDARTIKGLETGYTKLDQMLKGGLKSSRLFTVAARTGVGKTNWILGVTKRLCMAGKRVLLFSTEMPYTQIWERYLATLETPTEFTKHQFYVCDSFAPNLEKVEEAINQIKPDVFIFDHINHVSEEVKGLGEFMQGLNYLRRKYDSAGIVTAQLNRAADWVDLKTGEKVTPRMSMIKGSGTIEQASSRVLLLSEMRVTDTMTEIVGNLDKNDNGPKGLIHFGLLSTPYRMVEL